MEQDDEKNKAKPGDRPAKPGEALAEDALRRGLPNKLERLKRAWGSGLKPDGDPDKGAP